MNKKLLASAIAGTMVALPMGAQAAMSIGGYAFASAYYEDSDANGGELSFYERARLDFRATADLGNGNRISGRAEFDLAAGTTEQPSQADGGSDRHTYVEAAGGWGKLNIGHTTQISNAYVGTYYDPSFESGLGNDLVASRVDNQAFYEFSAGGFQAAAQCQASANKADGGQSGCDIWDAAAAFSTGAFYAAVAYSKDEGTDAKTTGIAATWSGENISVWGAYTGQDDGSPDNRISWTLSAIGDAGGLGWWAGYAQDKDDDTGRDDKVLGGGVNKSLGGGASVFVDIRNRDRAVNDVTEVYAGMKIGWGGRFHDHDS